LDQHRQGLGMIQHMAPQSAEGGTYDTRKGHAVEEVAQDGQSSDSVDLQCGATLPGKDPS
jgi:hypothetical protein